MVTSRCRKFPMWIELKCLNKTGNFRVSKKTDFRMKGSFCDEEMNCFMLQAVFQN